MPGDPFTYMSESGEGGGVAVITTEEELAEMKAYYGLDKPLLIQFFDTVKNNIRGEFGYSIYYKGKVIDILGDRLPWTMFIMLTSMTISMFIGTSLALFSVRHKRADSAIFNTLAFVGEVPSFLIGILLLFLIAAKVKAIPLSGAVTLFKTFNTTGEFLKDVFLHALMPLSAMVIVTTPSFYFTARSSFLTILSKKYILNAKAKGLSERTIKYKYILLNGIFPIVACFFMNVGASIGGTLLVENVFAYPGLGKTLREAVKYRDYILIQGIFFVSTTMVLLSSLLSDVINHYANKGSHHEKKK